MPRANRREVRDPRRQAARLALLLEVGLCGALASFHLSARSLWLDEALTLDRARLDWGAFWTTITQREPSMALYALLLRWWLWLGEDEFTLRFLSVLFAMATIPVVYALGARLFGRATGLTAGLLLAVNAFFIRYAQEARGYTLLLFLAALSLWFFIDLVERPSRAAWIGYLLSTMLAAYAHFFAALVFFAEYASLAFVPRSTVQRRPMRVAALLVLLSWSPLIPFALFHYYEHLSWARQPHLEDVHDLLATLSGGTRFLYIYLAFAIVGVFAKGTEKPPDPHMGPWHRALLCTALLLPIGAAYLLSLWRPIFVDRYLIACVLPLALLAARGLCSLRSHSTSAAALAVFVAWSVLETARGYAEPAPEDWRRATAFVVERSRPSDAATFYTYETRAPFEYYLRQFGFVEAPLTLANLSPPPFSSGGEPSPPRAETVERIAALHPRVWLLRSHDRNPPVRQSQARMIEEALGRSRRLRETRAFSGIVVQLFTGRHGP